MLLGVFVVVIEAQKLEVCIHKQNCTVESKVKFNSLSKYTSDDTDSIPIRICAQNPTENTQQPSRQLTVESLDIILNIQ